MAVNLTTGAISILSSGECQTMVLKPVLQVIDILIVQKQTPIGGGGENKERYIVLLSDGFVHQEGMLVTHKNEFVSSKLLQKGSIVQLTEYVCNTIRERLILIIIDLNVILSKCDIIGDSKPFSLQFHVNKTPSMVCKPIPQSKGKKFWTFEKPDGFLYPQITSAMLQEIKNMAINLTGGVISMLSSGEWKTVDLKPVLQVTDIRLIQMQNLSGVGGEKYKGDRYKVLLSDGSFHQQGILATHYNELVTSQQLQKGSIVQLTEFVCNLVCERIVIVIVDLDVILSKCDIIGDAKPFPVELPASKTPSMARPAPPMSSSVSVSRDSVPQTYLWKTISQIKDEKLGTSEKPDWITVNATIWYINLENFCYTACPIMLGNGKCSKKVVNNGDGKWRCDKCDQIVDECDYKYILKLQIHDHTGLTWITAFQETAKEIMGVSAKDLYFMKQEVKYEDRLIETVRGVLFSKYNFKLKVKEEFLVDEVRVISSVVKAEKI